MEKIKNMEFEEKVQLYQQGAINAEEFIQNHDGLEKEYEMFLDDLNISDCEKNRKLFIDSIC